MQKTTFYSYIEFLNNHPLWKSLSWEAKGMSLAIMDLSQHDNYKGTIENDETTIKNRLGMPSEYMLSKYSTITGNTFWKQIKKELFTWFIPIDKKFIKNHKYYKGCEDRLWFPILDYINEVNDNYQENSKETQKKNKPKKTKQLKQKTNIPTVWDYPIICFTKKELNQLWETPLSEEAKTTLWDTGVQLLTIKNSSKEEKTTRAFIGKLIKDFGEQNVASEIAKLSVRPVKPADPKSFLRKTLDNNKNGSASVQKARGQKARVAL